MDAGSKGSMAATWLLAVVCSAAVPETSPAQMAGGGRSLGGYGASAMGSSSRSRSGPPIPYLGGQGGFIPYRGLEPMRASPRPEPTRIGGASASMMLGGGRLPEMADDRGLGRPIGGLMEMLGRPMMPGPPMAAPESLRRGSGPGFGYPFRRPPLLGGGGAMMGPSM